MPKVKWISIKEAADLLSASDKTVRRRIKAKRYRFRYVKGASGDELRLRKDDVLKDVQASDDPGQQQISQDNSKGKEDTPGQVAEGDIASNVLQIVRDGNEPRVLLVDEDEKAIDFLSSRILRRYKMEVVVAEDGEEGLRLMEEKQPDLAIVEIAIPEIDGLELADKKSKRKEIEHIPMIFLSYLLREHSFVQVARHYPSVIGCFKKPLAGKHLEEFKRMIKEIRGENRR